MLTDEEKRIIEKYRLLSDTNKDKISDFVKQLIEAEQAQSEKGDN